ncbi:unnamed protein product [Dovyalis caffra]|uniref:NADH dehydrogenase [ubiquinone] 1 alpha subcomplex subunit 12 n=1 Tax=Dovyalis caffra TaxID=77055 RepID=A0AAV1RFR5_9ROSI|nr:unnamed protein product [Dovyalis caffra]
MSKLLVRIAGYLTNRTLMGVDKVGNRYFARTEQNDGIMKEKRWVVFKGEEDPTSIPVEWICWLNGQRRRAPTPEELIELEARRELVKQNVARKSLQEEEERRAKEGSSRKAMSTGKTGGPDLKSFIGQFPTVSEGNKLKEESDAVDRGSHHLSSQFDALAPSTNYVPLLGLLQEKEKQGHRKQQNLCQSCIREIWHSEPTGSGSTFKPGTWQPPT